MRIGQFAEHNHTSIDTIRHYMNMSLLIPQKVGAQYDFDAQCQTDYDEVCLLKDMGFVLADIQVLLQYQRLGQMTDYDKRATYQAFFQNKHNEIATEIEKLQARQARLSAYFDHVTAAIERPQTKLGVPFDALTLLRCPTCQNAFSIENGQVVAGQFMHATLSCSCGEQLAIHDGIVYGKGALSLDESQEVSGGFIDDYVLKTDTAYLLKLVRGLKWSKSILSFESLEENVILELGSGYGFFLRHFAGDFPATTVYVAVDHNPKSLVWLKKQLERNPPQCKLLFVCADFQTIPLLHQSVDLVLDISGSSNYAFEHEQFLLQIIEPYMKATTLLHGYYILFENFMSHSKIGLSYRPNLTEKHIRHSIAQTGFEELHSYTTESVSNGGPMEDYFVEGERVYSMFFHGIHRSKNGVNPIVPGK